MVKVSDLPKGWSLWADPDNGNPRFVGPYGPRTFREVAMMPEAQEIFRAVKRLLDTMDKVWTKHGAELRYKATDRAKFALQSALKDLGKWDRNLLDSGISLVER
jgi:hypothetical protein